MVVIGSWSALRLAWCSCTRSSPGSRLTGRPRRLSSPRTPPRGQGGMALEGARTKRAPIAAPLMAAISNSRVRSVTRHPGHASRKSLEIYSRLAIGDAHVAYDQVMRCSPVLSCRYFAPGDTNLTLIEGREVRCPNAEREGDSGDRRLAEPRQAASSRRSEDQRPSRVHQSTHIARPRSTAG